MLVRPTEKVSRTSATSGKNESIALQNKPTWGGKKCEKPCSVFGLRPSVSFCSASANNFHFGASLFFMFMCVAVLLLILNVHQQ